MLHPLTLSEWMAAAVQVAQAQIRHGHSPAWWPYGREAGQASAVEEALTGILKAFVKAALPAGGLTLDAQGHPSRLDELVQAGLAAASAGESQPKLLAKVRAGKPIDLRLAEAVMHFFRWALQRPAFSLDALGASDPGNVAALTRLRGRIERLRDELPDEVIDSILRRADEAAREPTIEIEPVVVYRAFEHFVDRHGVHRIRVERVMRSRPVRIGRFPGVVHPRQVYELHEWNHVERATLRLRRLDARGEVIEERHVAVRKHPGESGDLTVIDPEPSVLDGLVQVLTIEPLGLERSTLEVEWSLTLVFNVLDRDILVSYRPMHRPRIVFDPAAHPDFAVQVGDSPGLRRVADGWQLDRVLMPREVLAVRVRWRQVAADAFQTLTHSGDWLAVSGASPQIEG